MNKFACSALALAAAGSIGFADPATYKLDGGEWLGLDKDIVDLQLTTMDSHGGTVGALIRSRYTSVDDDLADDLAGFGLTDVDLWTSGSVGDFDWRISADFDGRQGIDDLDVDTDADDFGDFVQDLAMGGGGVAPTSRTRTRPGTPATPPRSRGASSSSATP